MTKKAGALIFLVSMIAILALPMLANAQNATGIPYWPTNGLISCVGNYSVGNITGVNPSGRPTCSSICDLLQTFVNIVYFIITVCIFVLAPIMFAVGGVMMIFSGANPEMLSKGKSVLLSTATGIAIVLCSYLLVFTFISVLNANSNGIFGGTLMCTPQYSQ